MKVVKPKLEEIKQQMLVGNKRVDGIYLETKFRETIFVSLGHLKKILTEDPTVRPDTATSRAT